jgi:hypothetical protein
MIGPHGHVIARTDGKKARCGGLPLCADCIRELAEAIVAAPERLTPYARTSLADPRILGALAYTRYKQQPRQT